MDDEISEVQILEYLSECLRIFRKRLMQMLKISQLAEPDTVFQAEQHLQNIYEQGATLLSQFSHNLTQFSKLQTVFARFVSRVKEMVNNTQLKSASVEVSNYLFFMSSLLKQSIKKEKVKFVLQCMLVNSAGKLLKQLDYQSHHQQKNNAWIKKLSQRTKSQHGARQISQKSLDNHQKFIVSLQRQYKLYKQLNLDQGEYRKIFFLARQDHHRKDTNLYEDMLFRNRLAQELLLDYRNGFQRYCRKLQNKMNKLKQQTNIPENFIKKPLTNFKVKEIKGNHSEKMIEISGNGNSYKNSKNKMKTDGGQQFGASTGQIFINKVKTQNKDNIEIPKRNKIKTQYGKCLATSQFFIGQKIFQTDKSRTNTHNCGNLMDLKKIHFMGSKIRLVPESKNQNQVKKLERKKNICKKTQDHFSRRISTFSQPKYASQISLNVATPMKPKNFTPLLIDYSKLLK